MKKLVMLVLVALGPAFAQKEAYQVPGFPPFDPALPVVEVIEDRGDTVLVRHSYGETEVPKNPQRIFANVGLEVALPLGLSVVGGTFVGGGFREMPPTLQAATRNITMFDAYAEPNLEAILSLQPDLIIDWHYEADPTRYEQFSRIAPTLSLLANPVYDWKQATRDMTAVFGLEARAEEVIGQYEAKVTEQCERIRSHVGEETLSIIRMREREVTLDGPGGRMGCFQMSTIRLGLLRLGHTATAVSRRGQRLPNCWKGISERICPSSCSPSFGPSTSWFSWT